MRSLSILGNYRNKNQFLYTENSVYTFYTLETL